MKTITILCGLLLSINAFSATLEVTKAKSDYEPTCESLQDLNNEKYALTNIQFGSENQGVAELTFDVQFSKCLVTDAGLSFVDYSAYDTKTHQYMDFSSGTLKSFQERNVRVEFYAVQNETELLDKVSFSEKSAALSINVADLINSSESCELKVEVYPTTVKRAFYKDGSSEIVGNGIWFPIKLDVIVSK